MKTPPSICPICKYSFTRLEALETHIPNKHDEIAKLIEDNDITIKQYLFNIRNRRAPLNRHGKSIVSGKETNWNEKAGKYDRILESEKEQYREIFSKRMIKIHNTNNLLVNPEQQIKMLAARKISGTYLYGKDKKPFTYTGSYELDFLEFMDHIQKWPAEDIMMPASGIVLSYDDPREVGRKRFYIPDAYIISLDLLLEIKDSGTFHYKERDADLEAAKDKAANDSKHHYLKVYDKTYTDLTIKLNELTSNLEP